MFQPEPKGTSPKAGRDLSDLSEKTITFLPETGQPFLLPATTSLTQCPGLELYK